MPKTERANILRCPRMDVAMRSLRLARLSLPANVAPLPGPLPALRGDPRGSVPTLARLSPVTLAGTGVGQTLDWKRPEGLTP